jgi:hypothetical protein
VTEEPAQLVAMARELLTRATPVTAGLWPRAAALLARNALEMAVDEYWTRRRIPLDSCPTFPQLICLREYLDDSDLAGRVHHAWNALSRACHQHPYELAPTAGELEALFETVAEFLASKAEPAASEADSTNASRGNLQAGQAPRR